MKNFLLFSAFVLSIASCTSSSQEVEKENSKYTFGKIKWENEWIERDTSFSNYPCTIDSTILTFFHNWNDSLTYNFKNIPDTSLANINHGIGRWLRNNYGLWSRTCLVDFFWKKGIFHPDDISAIILTSYHRFLNDKPLDIDGQVKMYQSFWKNEMDIVYRIEDSSNWEFPPSMWDFGMTIYSHDE